MTGYKSPIEIVADAAKFSFDDGILKAAQKIGIQVDKEELIKALAYDRDQYAKGYKDALEREAVLIAPEELEAYLHEIHNQKERDGLPKDERALIAWVEYKNQGKNGLWNGFRIVTEESFEPVLFKFADEREDENTLLENYFIDWRLWTKYPSEQERKKEDWYD